jgi:uncharacterized protein (TIGR02284 family)
MTTKVNEALENLVLINNERHEGFQQAAEDIEDSDLKSLFTTYATQSRQFGGELRSYIDMDEDAPDRDETSFASKLHRTWIDIKSAVSGRNRKAILASCEFGEDFALNAYKEALNDVSTYPAELQSIIQKQKASIQESHDRIKMMRDSL